MVDSTVEIRAREWRKLNSDVWAKFERHCLNEAAHERRVSVKWLIEDVRAHDYVNRIGDPCKINNSFAPIFARMLIHDHPELAHFIETRSSVYDGAV